MNAQLLLQRLLDRVSTIFVVLGLVAVLAGAGFYLVLGRLDRVSIILFAIALGLWAYAALEQPDQTVQTLSSRGVKYGTNTVLMGAAFLGILVLVNVLSNRFSTRLDLTQNQIYTLSPLSVQVINKLQQPVHIIAFYQSNDPSKTSLENVLKEYTQHSNKVTYEFVDPQIQPGLARQYNVQTFGTTVLVSGDKQQTTTGSDEGSLTSAMLKLERDKPLNVYYLTGHGELDFTNTGQSGASSIKSALENQNFVMKPLNLAATNQVPSDASLVIVAGPTAPLLPQEVTALESYLDKGGKAIFLVDKGQRQNLESI
ncbi:MAG TPA: GldG family protein, partial [Chloroflexota bacterium]|nr:GldG family protein [Chloroflexota bacterium]